MGALSSRLEPVQRRTVRQKVEGPLIFLLLSSLIHLKAVDIALQAFSGVRGNCRLHIVGDGPCRRELTELITTLSEERVQMDGTVSYHQVHEVMGKAHVLLAPSRSDGFGMVVLEGLAAGLPVIASDRVMSALQYLRHGFNGWIFPVDDASP